MCYGTEAPDVNCRTCVHSTPELDGNARWSCREHGRDLDEAEQNAGCHKHLHMPQLLANFAILKHAGDEIVIYTNALAPEREIHQPIHTSHDITNCTDKTTLGWDYSEHERAAVTFEAFLESNRWQRQPSESLNFGRKATL